MVQVGGEKCGYQSYHCLLQQHVSSSYQVMLISEFLLQTKFIAVRFYLGITVDFEDKKQKD
jgi:hypothetical protein